MNQFEKILRESFPPELPYGFAERTVLAVFGREEGRFWDVLLAMSPRTGLAIGAIATALVVLSFAGSAPGIIEAIDHYAQAGGLVALP